VEVNKEDFLEWKDNPVTRYYFKQINFKIIELCKAMGGGSTLNAENPHQTIVETAKAVGAIDALTDILNIEFEEGE